MPPKPREDKVDAVVVGEISVLVNRAPSLLVDPSKANVIPKILGRKH